MYGLKQTAMALTWKQWIDMGGCRIEGQVAFKAISALGLNDDEWDDILLETIVKASPAADEYLAAYAVKDSALSSLVIKDKDEPIAFTDGTRVIIKTDPWNSLGKDPRDKASLKGRHGEIIAVIDQEVFVRTDNGACVWIQKSDLGYELTGYEVAEPSEKNPPDITLSFGVFNPEDVDNWRNWLVLASRSLSKMGFFLQDNTRREHIAAMASELADISKALHTGWKSYQEKHPMAAMSATLHSMEQFIDYKEARIKEVGVDLPKSVDAAHKVEVEVSWHHKEDIQLALDKLSKAVGTHCIRIQKYYDYKSIHTTGMSMREQGNWILLAPRGEKGFAIGGPGAMKLGDRIKDKLGGKYNEHLPGFIFAMDKAARVISRLADIYYEANQK